MDTPEEEQAVDQVVGRLAARFPSVSRDEIARLVDEDHHAFDGNPIRDFVPVLVEHQVREKLAAAYEPDNHAADAAITAVDEGAPLG